MKLILKKFPLNGSNMSFENKSFEIIMNKNDTFLMIHHTKLALMFNTITIQEDYPLCSTEYQN